MSDKRNSIVAGPGHTLNELTNRLLQIMYQGTDGFSPWEMYPGPLGLYARHCDDFNFRNPPTPWRQAFRAELMGRVREG